MGLLALGAMATDVGVAAVSLARALLSKAWSGGSMIQGVQNMVPAVKQELPDDPEELSMMVKDST